MLGRRRYSLVALVLACGASQRSDPQSPQPAAVATEPGVDETTLVGYRRHHEGPLRVTAEALDVDRLLDALHTFALLDVGSPEESLDLRAELVSVGVPEQMLALADGGGRWVFASEVPASDEHLRFEVPTTRASAMLDALVANAGARRDSSTEVSLGEAEISMRARSHEDRVVFGFTADAVRAPLPSGLSAGEHLRVVVDDVAAARQHLLVDAGVDFHSDLHATLHAWLGRVQRAELTASVLETDGVRARAQVHGALAGLDDGLLGMPLQSPGKLERVLPPRPVTAVVASVGDTGAVRRWLDGRLSREPIRDPELRPLVEQLDALLDLVHARVGFVAYMLDAEEPAIAVAVEVADGEVALRRLDPLVRLANEKMRESGAAATLRYEHRALRRAGLSGHRFTLELPLPMRQGAVKALLHGKEARAALFVVDDVIVAVIGAGVDRLVEQVERARKGSSLAESFTAIDPYGEVEGGCHLCSISYDREAARFHLARAQGLDEVRRRHALRVLTRLPEGAGTIVGRLDAERLVAHVRWSGPLFGTEAASREARDTWRAFGEALRGEAGLAGRLRSLVQ